MAFTISPGVSVSEVDLTTVVPSVLTTAGAFAGSFVWGPVNQLVNVTSEVDLVNRFGQPNSNTYQSFFSAASFLAYGNNLNVVRAANTSSFNADSNTSSPNIQVTNSDVFQAAYLNSTNANTYGPFMARYVGALGNSLQVAVCANTSLFSTWTYAGYFTSAPGTSSQCSSAGGANDEMHVAVIDAGGLFTGSKGTVLETFPFLSKASDNKNASGNSGYYKNYIFNNSKYIYATDPVEYSITNSTWGQTSSTTFANTTINDLVSLSGGTDATVQDNDTINAYSLFTNPDVINISLVVSGSASITVQQYIIDNIVNSRADCVGFLSPRYSDVVNNTGSELTSIQSWATSLSRSTSYAVADSGWKYMFDKYNNTYRWIPLNGDTAGLCVYTDSVRDPWFSPAGLNRGNLKNVVKLAWNPNLSQRNTLYSSGINPVVSLPGQGTVLFGDKTLQSKPSAFDRINVRRLFIVLEKTIALAAQYSLFEFNDSFTQSQFVALVTPYLRDIQGRRGITDFRVVCDSTNNTPQVVDSNQFVGDIYIKPARSINFIQLNFIAVGTGVTFNEVVGQTGI
jgi:Phage tail sheath protein subtilisin-like domain/Phage tail sheath C-terminal domain